MFYLLLPSLEKRQALIAHLNSRDIDSVFHYLPLHLSEMGVRFGGRRGDCPITEEISNRLLRLPFYTSLTATDQARVIAAVKDFS
jgi:dTDP-4-amino-4,6-dideoxygalactose transaminase